ncbi:MAG: chromosomal replication initiator protein DnaA [Bacteroidales bacterium]|nr:chromosomal replication initiator protein DnaA [Bacteroidales bacterium]
MEKFDFHKIWDKCLETIKANISEVEFETWFKPLEVVSLENGALKLRVPSSYFYEYIEAHYIKILRASIRKELGPDAKLLYDVPVAHVSSVYPSVDKDLKNNRPQKIPVILSDETSKELPNPFVMPGIRPIKIESQLNENYSFDNFIEGPCNQLARSAGHAVALNPGKTAFNPFLIYSNVGLGKTHLAHAIGLETKKLHPEKTVLYVSADTFFRQFVEAAKKGTVNDFLQFYQSMIDVLIIDDIQFMKKEKVQDVFFQIFNGLHSAGKQLIITSDKAPADIVGMEERVLSRLKWGLNAELQVPDLNTRINIIKKKLFNNGGAVKMPEEVIEYLAFSVNTSVRELEGALISLIAQSTISKKEITIDLARQIVDGFVKSNTREITIDYIQKVVCGYFNVPLEKVLSNSRKHDIVEARHITMYLSRKLTASSLTTIGEKCGNRNHATVLHGCKTVENICETDKTFKQSLDEIEKKILD